MNNETLVGLAAKYKKTVAQLLGRWCVQQGIVYMPKSENKERMVENMGVFDFEISSDDMKTLCGMSTQDNVDVFKGLYEKCVVRDTPLAESKEGVKAVYTAD